MALKRFGIDGYGQLELNNVFFRREGAIEAQCALDPKAFALEGKAVGKDPTQGKIYVENGMLLAVDKANGIVKLPKSADLDGTLPIALNYSTEHMYDERHKRLGDYYLPAGTFYPRLGYPKKGEIWTTNCLAYDDTKFADDEALKTALEKIKETPLFGIPCENGAVKIVDAENVGEDKRLVLRVVKYYTMPDGTPGVKFQVIAATL